MARVRRLLRIAFYVANVLALAICVAAVALWVRSYRASDFLVWTAYAADEPRVTQREIVVSRGRAMFIFTDRRPEFGTGVRHLPFQWWTLPGESVTISYARRDERFQPSPPHSAVAGFEFVRLGYGTDEWNYHRVVSFSGPLPVLALLGALFPAISLARCFQARRRIGTLEVCCPACGYDLRATPDKCPECGQVPAGR
jgi:hypothetical protein